VDTTVGAGLVLFRADAGHSTIRFGLTVDLGVAFAGSVSMRFSQSQVDGLPQNPGALNLPDFRPMGFVDKIAATVAF
jgi:hypothetical protein